MPFDDVNSIVKIISKQDKIFKRYKYMSNICRFSRKQPHFHTNKYWTVKQNMQGLAYKSANLSNFLPTSESSQ